MSSRSIVNDVGLTYNSFGQLISDAQSHSGAVAPGTTPLVQYAYANGSSNTIRPTTLTYPNGRAITVSYGTTGGINDSITRVDGLIDGSTTLVNYAYLGLSVPVQTTYPQPSIQYTLLGSSTGTSPAGDIYWGLDQFGRIIDSRWLNTGTSADVDRIKYGYDRASNRIWRQNPVATAAGAQFDELYTNDGLQRLKDMQRGTLNSTNTGITVPTFEQCWTLDPTGNWLGFHEATLGGWPLDQSRTANTVNEITGITNTTGGSWATPTYDAAGNMTTIPRVSVPVGPLNWATLTSTDWSNLTTDQWSSMDVGPSSSGTGNAFTATYDAWNRLITIADASTGQTVQQNQYDARTFRTVILSYTAGVLLETRHSYFSSEWRCIEERVGTATTAERQFVWGVRYIDDHVLRDRGTERLYALQDVNWNVTTIADVAGAIQERYAYTAYGTPAFLTSIFGLRSTSGFTWETLYSGYRLDRSSEIYSVRHRAYHPSLGCWVSRDLLGHDTDTNLFQYCAAQPYRRLDPFGQIYLDLITDIYGPLTVVETFTISYYNSPITATAYRAANGMQFLVNDQSGEVVGETLPQLPDRDTPTIRATRPGDVLGPPEDALERLNRLGDQFQIHQSLWCPILGGTARVNRPRQTNRPRHYPRSQYFTPHRYWQRNSPMQTTPPGDSSGIVFRRTQTSTNGRYDYRIDAYYDQYGRYLGETHWTTHPSTGSPHPMPHFHMRNMLFNDNTTPFYVGNSAKPKIMNPEAGGYWFPGQFPH
ncbi:MAG: RHS repeat-associated core domain-containing protein [Schlesneria sp.]